MKTLIFSKDRACQLQLLLESIFYFDHNHVFEPIVLWTVSSSRFYQGYAKLISRYDIKYIKQCATLVNEVRTYLETYADEYCMFLVDDQFMRYPLLFDWDEVDSLFRDNNLCTLSLRLGQNTTFQYQSNTDTVMPVFNRRGSFLVWNRSSIPFNMNFGYPLSVDAHIYRTHEIRFMIGNLGVFLDRYTPNHVEARLQAYLHHVGPLMACQEESAFVNNPLNLVQHEYQNRHSNAMTAEELNEAYLDGQIFDLREMIMTPVVGTHQDICPALKDKG